MRDNVKAKVRAYSVVILCRGLGRGSNGRTRGGSDGDDQGVASMDRERG